jgi:hypothetical protein
MRRVFDSKGKECRSNPEEKKIKAGSFETLPFVS